MLSVFAILIVVRFLAFYSDVRLVSVGWTSLVLAGVSEAFARACRGERIESVPAQPQSSEILDVLPADLVTPRTARSVLKQRRPPGAGLFLIGILAGGILALMVGVAGVIVFFKMGSGHALPVALSNARITMAMGIAIHIKVDYRCQEPPVAERQYVLVVEQDGRSVAQRSFPGTELQDRGTLDIDVLANLLKRTGRLSIFLEQSSASGTVRQRVSDVISVSRRL
jgi:hypothetical protein